MYPQIYVCGTGEPLPPELESKAAAAIYAALAERFGGEPLLQWAYLDFLRADESELEPLAHSAPVLRKPTPFEREFDRLAPLVHSRLALPKEQQFAYALS